MPAGDDLLDTDLRPDDGTPYPQIAPNGTFPPLRTPRVAPPLPRGSGDREPDGGHDRDHRHEHPRESGPDLALKQADDRSGEVDQHEHHQTGPHRAATSGEPELLPAERAHAREQ